MSIGILPNVISTKWNRDVKHGISVFSRTTSMNNNQVKMPKKSFNSPKRRESDDKGAVAIVKTVPQLSCVSQDSEPSDSPRGAKSRETRCKKSWDQFEEHDSLSLRYVMQVSGKRKDLSLGKINVKAPHL